MNEMTRPAFTEVMGERPIGGRTESVAVPHQAPADALSDNARNPIGVVLEIAGSGSAIALDMARLNECMDDADPSIALAGQVGSQIKIRTRDGWLLASVRNQKRDRRGGESNAVIANIDFMGEGMEERLTGKIHGFRRGVTRYPIPGALVYPASTDDLRQIYSSDGRSSIQIGTVYPTTDIRAAIYVDALLGSTGTGKSTSAALLLHRICQAAPQGHIVMIDPHGEYSAAFRTTGTIFDVSNLQMPYWLLNFE
ncbi:MAG TPA: ATP-binding protein, partial [Paracoccaceae bacterium]|nr:ATP-binding protein [Paracoccaceae bacterium]